MNPLRPTWTVRFKEHQCLSMTRRSPKSLISTRSRKHTSWGPCLHQRPRRMTRLSNDSKIPCWVQSPWGDHEQFLISSNKFTVPRIPEICSEQRHSFSKLALLLSSVGYIELHWFRLENMPIINHKQITMVFLRSTIPRSQDWAKNTPYLFFETVHEAKIMMNWINYSRGARHVFLVRRLWSCLFV